MIVVEGPDGAGKTVMVQRIMEMWPEVPELTLVPRSVSKEAKSLVQLDDYVDDNLALGFGPRLYDRFALISAPCYIPLPKPTFQGRFRDIDWLKAKHHQLQKIDPLIVLCLPPLETVVNNVMSDPDNEVVRDSIEKIYCLYLQFAATQVHNTSCMIWNYTDPDSDFSLDRLDNLLGWAGARIERGE